MKAIVYALWYRGRGVYMRECADYKYVYDGENTKHMLLLS